MQLRLLRACVSWRIWEGCKGRRRDDEWCKGGRMKGRRERGGRGEWLKKSRREREGRVGVSRELVGE